MEQTNVNLLQCDLEKFELQFMKDLIEISAYDQLKESKGWLLSMDIEEKISLIKEDGFWAKCWANFLEIELMETRNELYNNL